ncbi:hypothetical protein [Devosia sp. MC521]|uniref:hypothetical protein n=1 Tax=Devosia sp. MC521 TaxID=2759954 RepID=UPI0015F95BD6|nr:hypothetical protein [Devosia sp. MC521]MBJ6986084.1 hypothetical protein [Devosia sp. MC521]QMW61453.1 hypothetical protein H4N61_10725 [Devosia sp. MC521]
MSDDDKKDRILDNIERALSRHGISVRRDGGKILAFRPPDVAMPQHLVERFEALADMQVNLEMLNAAGQVYVAAVRAAGGEYEHALAGVWRSWHAEDGGNE